MLGPIQFLTVAINTKKIPENLKNAVKQLEAKGQIRIIDASFVSKDPNGKIIAKSSSGLNSQQKVQMGAAIGALIGYGANGEDGLKPGAELGAKTSYAIHNYGLSQKDLHGMFEDMEKDSCFFMMLVEHLWAKDIKKALQSEDIEVFAQGLITPETLVEAGETIAELEDISPGRGITVFA